MSLALRLTAALAISAAPGNAWTAWMAPDPAPDRLDLARLPAAPLGAGQQVLASQLAAAAAQEAALDRAVARLRRGLARKVCRETPGTNGLALHALAQASVARALLAASRGEDFTDLAQSLVEYARRLSGCDAGLGALQAGHFAANAALALARWAVYWGLWDARQGARVTDALGNGGARPAGADMVDRILATALARLPP
ncbi:MAG TPA: hypothetical protein VMB50_10490, partial [Myxococcales bacterium]|nr:hypothetical protein [Myxococcales bacterium]